MYRTKNIKDIIRIPNIIACLAIFSLSGCSDLKMVKLKAYNGSINNDIEKSHLRCTSFVAITSIDDNIKFNVPPQSEKNFTDCDITLRPGSHTIDACFSASAYCRQGYEGLIGLAYQQFDNTVDTDHCKNQTLKFDAKPGRIYRLNKKVALDAKCDVYRGNYYYVELSINDETENEVNRDAYDNAKKSSNMAKSLQKNNKWSESLTEWNNAIKYATNGDIDKQAQYTLHMNYANALSSTCQYTDALIQLQMADELAKKYNWQNNDLVMAMARTNLLAGNIDSARNYYAQLETEQASLEDKNEVKTFQSTTNNISIINQLITTNPELQYGKHCSESPRRAQ